MKNKVELIGRIGNGIRVHDVNGNNKFVTFSVATDDSYRDKNGNRVERTDWHQCLVSGKLAEIVESYASKGMLVNVEGKIKPSKPYTTPDGVVHQGYHIVVDRFLMFERIGGSEAAKQRGQATPQAPATHDNEADLPF